MWAHLLPMMTYCFVMSSTPGPNNLLLATSSATFGYRRALPQIFGTNSGVAMLTFFMCLGLGQVFTAYPVLRGTLRVCGALYLIFLAYQLSGSAAGALRSAKPLSFAQAALFQVVNPKSWVKSITLASVFMPAGLSTPAGAMLVAAVGLLIGFPSASLWALFGISIRRLLNDPRKRRVFNLSMAAMMVVLALNFLR